jgi:triphosphoribosyl-dephospho-CoA synthase
VTLLSEDIAGAFKAACLDELAAPKPGNVHVFAAGHRMTASEFVRSAEAAAGPLAAAGASVGTRILGAVEATYRAVRANTNLGIVLLCAPLAAAADRRPSDLRAAVMEVLESLDRNDADRAFRAIVLASPGGIGRAERHDVFAPAVATLREAMAEAAERDRIARQYVCGFEDVFDLGESLLDATLPTISDPRWATLCVYLRFLSAFPDSHIVRKHGAATADQVRRTAVSFGARLCSTGSPAELIPDLLAWDTKLKEKGVNPGTSADLTVATLFVHRLRSILPSARNSG